MNKLSNNPSISGQQTSNALKSLKLLASDARFDILFLLHNVEHKMCVGDIAESIDLSHSATSHQLSKLENAGVLAVARDGQTRCYDFANTPLAEQTLAFIDECSV